MNGTKLIIIVSFVIFLVMFSSNVYAWAYSGWALRLVVTVHENSGNTLTNYQVFLNVSYNSKMQPDFDDLRFTWLNGSTEQQLNYWIENKVDSSYADVWVKVPEIPASSDTTLYMYYNNSAATSESNEANTSYAYDNFSSDTSANYSETSSTPGGNFFVNTTAGYLVVNDTGGTETWYTVYYNVAGLTNLTMVAKIQGVNEGVDDWKGMSIRTSSDRSYLYRIGYKPSSSSGDKPAIAKWVNNTESQIYSETNSINDGSWYTVRMKAVNNNLTFIIDEINFTHSFIDNDVDGSHGNYFGFLTHQSKLYIDWFYVRKLVYPEPTYNFSIPGLNVSAFDNTTSSPLTNWNITVSNATNTNTSVNLNNPSLFAWYDIPYGNINVTVSKPEYFSQTQSTTNNATTIITLLFNLTKKPNQTITMSASPSWSITQGNSVSVSCSATEGTPIIKKDGVTVSNPYTATLSFGNYHFICETPETENYSTSYTDNYLAVLPTGFGCTNSTTFAFEQNVTSSYNITTLNFTTMVNESMIKKDLSDVYVEYNATKNTTNGYYFNVDNNANNFTIYFGNYYVNNSYSFNTTGSHVIDIKDYEQINPYYVFTVVDESKGVQQIPPSSNTTASIYCSGGTTSIPVNDTKFLVSTFQQLDGIKSTVTYSATEEYYRNLYITNPIEYKNIYLADATRHQVVQMLFSLTDYTGQFDGSEIKFKRWLGNQIETITEHKFDIENKVVAYLINGESYFIYLDNGKEERVIGNLTVDSVNPTKNIVIGQVSYVEPAIGDISYSLNYSNVTGIVSFDYNDPSNQTKQIDMWVYDYPAGTELTHIVSTNSSKTSLNYIVSNPSASYKVNVNVDHYVFGDNAMHITKIFNGTTLTIPFPLQMPSKFVAGMDVPWQQFVMSVLLIGIVLIFGAYFSGLAGIVVVLFAAVFTMFGWINIRYEILAGVFLLALINKFAERRGVD